MRRLLRLFSLAVAGIVLGLTLYAGLVHIGLARSLLAPTLRGDIALARSDRPGLRVLFVGNSFTFKNSLPALVHDLAAGVFGARATLVGAAALGAAVTLSAFFLPGMPAIERTGGRRQDPWHVPVDATD